MSRSKIQVVSFDAAGTLIHLAEPVGVSYARVAGRHGVSIDPARLGVAFAAVWRRTAPPFSPGTDTVDRDERSWWGRLVADVFAEAGAPFPEGAFEGFFDELYRHFEEPGTWFAEGGTRELVEEVASLRRCVVLSNFDARLRRILADLDLLNPFERIFLSCEERLAKPDPRFFLRVSESLGVPPAGILHVGDDPVCDWAGADSAGFRHFRAGRGQRPLRELLDELLLAGL